MPHHSKQLQLQRSFSGSLRQQRSFPEAATANHNRILQNNVSMPPSASGRDNPNSDASIQWGNLLHRLAENKPTQELYHRVPQSPPESKVNNIEQLKKQPLQDADIGANGGVLGLLAAAATDKANEEEASAASSRPPKKRKVKETTTDSIHVSPMSSKTDGTVDTATATTAMDDTATMSTSVASRVMSYEDTKGEEEHDDDDDDDDDEHSKNNPLPHLPNSLHWLLTESSSQSAEHAAAIRTVIHWVPHGQAFSIVRWDAFRNQILPKFFPEYNMSIDLFLSQLKLWGFCEISDGPDVGAFAHNLFRRGHPQLCQEMTCAEEVVQSPQQHRQAPILTDSQQHQHQHILRVPSLTSHKEDEIGSKQQQQQQPLSYWSSCSSRSSPIVHYRSEQPHGAPISSYHRPPYSPIRIRSGRGARRLNTTANTNTSVVVRPLTQQQQVRTTSNGAFPVSNRGRRQGGGASSMIVKRKLPTTTNTQSV